jgi:hypothetical protein
MSKSKSIYIAFRVNPDKEPEIVKILEWLKANRYKTTDIMKTCLKSSLCNSVIQMLATENKMAELEDFSNKLKSETKNQ